MEVTHCTSSRRINDCQLTSDLLFQLSIHPTILSGSSGMELAEDAITGDRHPTKPLGMETATQARPRLCCVHWHSSWEVLSASHLFLGLQRQPPILLRNSNGFTGFVRASISIPAIAQFLRHAPPTVCWAGAAPSPCDPEPFWVLPPR